MNLFDVMQIGPVIPVIVIDRLEHAVPLASALLAGGVRVLEVTLRTPVALEAVRAMVREVPKAIVGVGTITDPEAIDSAPTAGARFGVSPGLTPALAQAAQASGLPLLPGVMTPSEIIAARQAGFRQLKLFPAQQAGGVGMLKAMRGPFPDITFCPTGGVNEDNAPQFLQLANVGCVGGSWLTPPAVLEAADWAAVTRLAKRASALSRATRN